MYWSTEFRAVRTPNKTMALNGGRPNCAGPRYSLGRSSPILSWFTDCRPSHRGTQACPVVLLVRFPFHPEALTTELIRLPQEPSSGRVV